MQHSSDVSEYDAPGRAVAPGPLRAPDLHRLIFDQVASGVAVYEVVDGGDDFVFVDLNPAAERIDQVRRSDLLGRRVTEAFPDVGRFGLLDVFRRVWRTGAPESHPLARYSDGRIAGWRVNRVFRLPTGGIVAIYDDRSREVEMEAAEAHQAMLAAELNHRVKNLLASIGATMHITLRSASSLEDFDKVFSARLQAISRGADLLLRTEWRPVELAEVLREALEPFGPACRISTPARPLRIPARTALGLNLIIHELATNASKYGALCAEKGVVRLDCRPSDDRPGRLVFRWVERHGPRVEAPRRRGFGSRLIEQAARRDLRGEVSIRYLPAGLECTLSFPADGGGN